MRAAPTITCFRDALGLAMELSDDYAFANAGIMLNSQGRVVDGVITDDVGISIRPVVQQIVDRQRHRGLSPPYVANSAVLLSIRPVDGPIVREHHLADFRWASGQIAAVGGRLADWIETDGDVFRSYAYLVYPASAWVDDSPSARAADGQPPEI